MTETTHTPMTFQEALDFVTGVCWAAAEGNSEEALRLFRQMLDAATVMSAQALRDVVTGSSTTMGIPEMTSMSAARYIAESAHSHSHAMNTDFQAANRTLSAAALLHAAETLELSS